MTRIRTTGVCLVVALAVGATQAASAVALPEFTPPFPKKFTSTSKKTTLETLAKTKVTCTADTDSGEITAPQAGTATIRYTGCEAKKFPCVSPGASASGEIVTSVLTLTLGYINRESKEVGVDLGSPPTGAPTTTFVCGNLTVELRGSIIGAITPTDKPVIPPKHFTLKFKQSKGKQSITSLAGGPLDVPLASVAGGPLEEAGLSSTDSIVFAEPVQINA